MGSPEETGRKGVIQNAGRCTPAPALPPAVEGHVTSTEALGYANEHILRLVFNAFFF